MVTLSPAASVTRPASSGSSISPAATTRARTSLTLLALSVKPVTVTKRPASKMPSPSAESWSLHLAPEAAATAEIVEAVYE